MLFRYELRRFRRGLPLLALLFIFLVPAIYGALYLSANWDPYGAMDRLPVAIVNEKLAERLFAEGHAIGKEIRVGGQQMTVIGLYHQLGNAFDSGEKGRVYVPFETARRRLDTDVTWLDLTVKPRDGVARDAAMDEALTLLRTERRLHPGEVNNFFVSTPDKILELYNKVVGAFFLVMLVPASTEKEDV